MPEKLDEDLKREICIACLRSYCYSQGMCSSKCVIQNMCDRTSNSLGTSDGDFNKWHNVDLHKAAKLINGRVLIFNDNCKIDVNFGRQS